MDETTTDTTTTPVVDPQGQPVSPAQTAAKQDTLTAYGRTFVLQNGRPVAPSDEDVLFLTGKLLSCGRIMVLFGKRHGMGKTSVHTKTLVREMLSTQADSLTKMVDVWHKGYLADVSGKESDSHRKLREKMLEQIAHDDVRELGYAIKMLAAWGGNLMVPTLQGELPKTLGDILMRLIGGSDLTNLQMLRALRVNHDDNE